MKAQLDLTDDDKATLSNESLASAIDQFDEHGALWIHDLLAPSFVSELQAAYHEKYISQGRDKLRRRYAVVGEERFMVTVKIKPPFDSAALTDNPVLMPIINHFVGQDCVVSSFGSVVAFPGADAQPVHFDYPPLFESESLCSQLPPHALTLVIPLVDLDQETGSTGIWEGSHRRSDARQQLRQLSAEPSWQGASYPLAKRGDVYLMDFRLIHAGMPNVSQIPRPILYVVYSRPWFREDANFPEQPPISISRKRFKRLTKSQQRLFASAKGKFG